MTSTTKTFEEQQEIGDIINWVVSNIETNEREVIYGGSEPSLDIITETKFKYKITIKKVTENKSF